MRFTAQPASSRIRKHLHAAVALLSLALWLFVAVAASWTPLHLWLHGGAIPDNDDCAIVVATHGKVDLVDCVVSVSVPAIWVELPPQIIVSEFSPAIASLPLGRAPPVQA